MNDPIKELDSLTGRTRNNKFKCPRQDDFVPLPEITTLSSCFNVYERFSSKSDPYFLLQCFQVKRGLDFISKNRLEVTEMRSGDLLIKVPNNKVADQLLKAKYIDCIPVEINLHNILNST